MTCERYWREGILLVERGLADPHRDGCEDCTRAHASRQELIEALPLIGASDIGDPNWQAKVWQRIDGKRGHAMWRWRWQIAGALSAACIFALWIGLRSAPPPPRDVQSRIEDVPLGVTHGQSQIATAHPPVEYAKPQIEIIPGSEPMRSNSAHVGDRLRVTVRYPSNVWIYHDGHLALSCSTEQALESASGRCVPTDHGMIAEMPLSTPGTYRVITIRAPVALHPHDSLDEDRGALEAADVPYDEDHRTVH
jgi:hypothetical protein